MTNHAAFNKIAKAAAAAFRKGEISNVELSETWDELARAQGMSKAEWMNTDYGRQAINDTARAEYARTQHGACGDGHLYLAALNKREAINKLRTFNKLGGYAFDNASQSIRYRGAVQRTRQGGSGPTRRRGRRRMQSEPGHIAG